MMTVTPFYPRPSHALVLEREPDLKQSPLHLSSCIWCGDILTLGNTDKNVELRTWRDTLREMTVCTFR